MNVKRAISAHIDTLEVISQLFASIGWGVYAKRGMNVSFYTSMTCQRCPSATSTPSIVNVVTRNVNFCTWIENRRSKTAHGMIVDSVGMDRTARIDTWKKLSVRIICSGFVQRALHVNSSSKFCHQIFFLFQSCRLKLIRLLFLVLSLICQLLTP